MSEFDDFCRMVLAPIARADQRRAGQAYLYGLLHCTGRKSIRRLACAAHANEQALRQFISRSPWDPVPIRRQLAAYLDRTMQPTAWVAEEVVFPKHGRMSAAVGRQYARSLGRVLNCQVGVAVCLADARASIPVNWRLVVPEEWGSDPERRARTRLPEHALPHPFWQYQVQAVEEMAGSWRLPATPVLLDATNRVGTEPLLAALEHRKLPFLVQVGPNLNVSCNRPLPPGATTFPWRGSVDELAARVAIHAPDIAELGPADPDTRGRSRFLRLAVRPLVADVSVSWPVRPLPRQVLCQWPPDRSRPTRFWITNLVDRSLADLAQLVRLGSQSGPRIEELAAGFGLRDHEGRTYPGWHHHVTLVAAAYAFHLQNGWDPPAPDGWSAVHPADGSAPPVAGA